MGIPDDRIRKRRAKSISDDERLAVLEQLGHLPDLNTVRGQAMAWAATAAGEHLREVRADVERDIEKTRQQMARILRKLRYARYGANKLRGYLD